MAIFGNRWDDILKEDLESPSYQQLRQFLREEYAGGPV